MKTTKYTNTYAVHIISIEETYAGDFLQVDLARTTENWIRNTARSYIDSIERVCKVRFGAGTVTVECEEKAYNSVLLDVKTIEKAMAELENALRIRQMLQEAERAIVYLPEREEVNA